MTKDDIIKKLRQVFDPEVSVNIYDLGLIYDIDVSENKVNITMTLTSPFCPAGDMIYHDVVMAAYDTGVSDVEVQIVFDPPWGPDKISDEGKLELGLF